MALHLVFLNIIESFTLSPFWLWLVCILQYG